MTETATGIADAVRDRLAAAQTLPLPGHGATAIRWDQLTTWSREHVVVGRLLEAHADAAAILTELGADPPAPGEWWGVWAAEPPRPVVTAHPGHEHGPSPAPNPGVPARAGARTRWSPSGKPPPTSDTWSPSTCATPV